MFEERPRKKKKVDYEALHSPLNRIPGIDLLTVRDLLDEGFSEVDDLRGRAPEVIYAAICDRKPGCPPERLYALRMAVYFAETDNPDPARLQPWMWKE